MRKFYMSCRRALSAKWRQHMTMGGAGKTFLVRARKPLNAMRFYSKLIVKSNGRIALGGHIRRSPPGQRKRAWQFQTQN